MLRAVTRSTVVRNSLVRLYASKSYPSYTVINMPALSPTMTSGNLASWSKNVGDQLAVGEVLAEVETDKATMDFEFQDDGYLAQILVPNGSKDIPVNKPIGIFVEEKKDVDAFKDFTIADIADAGSATATPAEKKSPESSADAAPAEKPSPAAQKTAGTDVTRIFASPLAKNIALAHGVALKDITGTGPRGRIVRADVEKFMSEQKSAASPAAAASTPAPAQKAAQAPSAQVSDLYKDIEITTMRNIIGKRLLESTQSIPSYIVSSDIAVSKLLKLRQSLNNDNTIDKTKNNYKLSINDILIKAISLAAKRIPDVNAYWLPQENVIRQFKNVDVSVAVATETGLITPIVKSANAKGLVSISTEVKDLVKRAKINKLLPAEFQGGTICISNLGMNDAVSMFTSIINPPQSTILAIGTKKRQAIEDVGSPNGISFQDVITITGTFDHRVVDGSKAGEFMRELKKIIENPLQLLL
ncbi:hypothetical protein TPHA_0F01420 [Tetrapisispora phaffii CBS 4417]|uniref:Acetyltransferase component of pyruvate dehydrogenase complex n=1 Tax=Tetrapisispora phaffii (strain ATCC 24235 / CBS 4417 / NBRC 1672 / NRRL Y-8282 / UCD 70-5) TaxID=1071381 RepID=G8BV44_TETPH|nr:hypothetical protein TPHA_0F01420 [Tetrapisispora phaffii CBS 4417]CCE63626.1 hypothetical protein TPHA_0F01420 [Tetrapisispora phaffii CBS 4417]